MKILFVLVFSFSISSFSAQTIRERLSLYETFEKSIVLKGVSGIKFKKYVDVEFRNGDKKYEIKAFYFGGDVWKIRFMPPIPGKWTYSWEYEETGGRGSFYVKSKVKSPDVHGHLHRQKDILIYDDGTLHYWFGGKWIEAPNYGQKFKNGVLNTKYLDDETFTSYFDILYKYRHNGLLLKVALYPLEDDGIVWDTTWINRADWLIREMGKRGIYCQINFWDTWGRAKGEVFTENTQGEKQVLNGWNDGQLVQKENYIKYLVSRFSGFYNVYWELGNEVEHHPNSGAAFAEQANRYYLSWIRKYDAYNLPIGLSENIWRNTDVDIGFCHNPWGFPKVTDTIPIIHNEQVSGVTVDDEPPCTQLWNDETIRDSSNRYLYRRTFWMNFTLGGNGTSECTWLDINKPLSNSVLNVMNDQMLLRNFIETLPLNFSDLKPDVTSVLNSSFNYQMLSLKDKYFVIYFYKNVKSFTADAMLKIQLPDGKYKIQWFVPATGKYSDVEVKYLDGQSNVRIPKFREDIVLTIMRD